MRGAAIGLAILIYGAEIKRAGERCGRMQDFLWFGMNEEAAIFEPRPNFS